LKEQPTLLVGTQLSCVALAVGHEETQTRLSCLTLILQFSESQRNRCRETAEGQIRRLCLKNLREKKSESYDLCVDERVLLLKRMQASRKSMMVKVRPRKVQMMSVHVRFFSE
jgi:hypothetical protein